MKHEFETNQEYSDRLNKAGWPNSYYGDFPTYYVFLGRSRDSDLWEESNFLAALDLLGGESDDIIIERAGHWAVGWVEHIAINPCNADKVKIAENIRERLESYPVLDEEDFCEREFEEYSQEFNDYCNRELRAWCDDNEDIPQNVIDKAREISYDFQGYSDSFPWDEIKEELIKFFPETY